MAIVAQERLRRSFIFVHGPPMERNGHQVAAPDLASTLSGCTRERNLGQRARVMKRWGTPLASMAEARSQAHHAFRLRQRCYCRGEIAPRDGDNTSEAAEPADRVR